MGWWDEWGWVPILIAILVALVMGIVGVCWGFAENSCNHKGEQYDLPADFDFWANRCYVTLEDGRHADVEQIRVTSSGWEAR